jgi:hypothetical protein
MKVGTKTINGIAGCLAVLVTTFTAVQAAGQQHNNSAVQPAAFTRSAPGSSPQQVTFSRRAAVVGDQIEQNIGIELRMTMTTRQGNEIAGKQLTNVRTEQRRLLTATEIDNGRMTTVKVHYPVAAKQESATEANAPSAEPVVAHTSAGANQARTASSS